VFDWLQQQGDIDEAEMRRTFNCGIGFVLIVAADAADNVLSAIDMPAWRIGRVIETGGDEQRVRYLAG